MHTIHCFVFFGTGIHFSNEGNEVLRNNYPHGNGLTVFDLTRDLSANTMLLWNLIKHGSLRIEIRFKAALRETISPIVYEELENVVEINKNRMDFGS